MSFELRVMFGAASARLSRRAVVVAVGLAVVLGVPTGAWAQGGLQIPGLPVPAPKQVPKAAPPTSPPVAAPRSAATPVPQPSARASEPPPAAPADAGQAPANADAQPAPAVTRPKPTPPPPLVVPEEITQPVTKLTADITAAEAAVEQAKEQEEELIRLRGQIQQIQKSGREFVEQLRPKIDSTRQQLGALGEPPKDKDAPPEPDAVAHERFKLNGLIGAMDGATRTADLISERASQLMDRIQQLQRDLFTRSLLRRTPSPILPTLWVQLLQELKRATEDIMRLGRNWWAITDGHRSELMVGAGGLLALWLVLRTLLRVVIRRYRGSRDGVPGFFARAAAAAWIAPLLALPAVLCVGLAYLLMDQLDLLYLGMRRLMIALLQAVAVLATVGALATALLAPKQPTWRLFDLTDHSARRIRRLVLLIAGVYAVDLFLKELNNIVFAPLSVTIAQSFLAGVSFATLLIALLLTPFSAPHVPATREPQPHTDLGEPPLYVDDLPPVAAISTLEPRWLKLPLWLVALGIIAAALLGYVSLARFLSGQVIISGSILVALALMHLAIRAFAEDMIVDDRQASTWLQANFGFDQARRRQLAFLFSAVVNGGLVLLAAPVILLQWGFDFDVVQGWLKAALFGFHIGSLEISLIRLLVALGILVAGYFGTRMVQRSLDKTVLVPPRMDLGIANSIRTAVGYAGIAASVLLAASYAGLDFTNLAIVAGALSVGIGFGLQSVISNFVSGLILLVERPVKVGDWIVVGSDEGYVRRISVRSTEIETFDRSSVIIPNAELIQGRVKNWTLRDAVGRVRIPVGIGYGSDPEKARQLLLELAAAEPGVLRQPAPFVTFVGFGASSVDLALNLFVTDVNGGAAVKTNMAFKILRAFQQAGIEMPFPQTDVHLRDLDPLRDMLDRVIEERRRAMTQPPSPPPSPPRQATPHQNGEEVAPMHATATPLRA